MAKIIDIVVTCSCWPHGHIMLANTHDRPPKIVNIFLFPRQYARISHRHIDQCEQTRILRHGIILRFGDFPHDLVIHTRRRTQIDSPVVTPINAD
jgi:hypothetical protein